MTHLGAAGGVPGARFLHERLVCCLCGEPRPASFSATAVQKPRVKAPKARAKAPAAERTIAASKPHRIDVHHHIIPPRYLSDMGLRAFPEKAESWIPMPARI